LHEKITRDHEQRLKSTEGKIKELEQKADEDTKTNTSKYDELKANSQKIEEDLKQEQELKQQL